MLSKKMLFNFLVIILLPLPAATQDEYDNKISRNRSLLNNLENEINKIKEDISSTKQKEKSLLKQLNLLDKETALISRSRGVLEQQRKLLAAKNRRTAGDLAKAEKRIKQLKDLYAKRAVYTYKYGRIQTAQLLLKSNSINQALIRYRYLKQIADHDKRMLSSIQKKKDQINDIKQKLTSELRQKQQNLSRIRKREMDYSDKKRKKEIFLKKVHWNQSKYRERLKEKENQKQNLIKMILALEEARRKQGKEQKAPETVHFDFKDFRKAKGRLPWPVKGRIITKYGRQYDPKTKTNIKNTDIEIQSKLGTPVHCVFSGVVKVITYLPGYGNTVIIDHGKGYYTVYSHLAEIYVHKDSIVETSQVIASVGDSGSLAGAKLQFGIYGGQSTYNPVNWLKKSYN